MYMDEEPGPSSRFRGRGYGSNQNTNQFTRGRGGRMNGYNDADSRHYQAGRNAGRYSDRNGYQDDNHYNGGRASNSNYRGRSSWGYQGAPYRGRGRGRGRGFQDPDDVKYLKNMRGHQDGVTTMIFDEASGKTWGRYINQEFPAVQLFTGSKDCTVRVWDYTTGQCEKTVQVGGEVHSMLCSSGFLFVGVHQAHQTDLRASAAVVKVYNIAAGTEDTLEGHRGPVYSLALTDGGMLFSGGQDAAIRVWQYNQELGKFMPQVELSAAQNGHQAPVSCLLVDGAFLYSADYKGIIKVWDLSSGQCTQSVENAHQNVIMSLLAYKQHILSASVDGSIRVWAMCEPAAPGAVIQPQPSYIHPPSDDVTFGKILALQGTIAPDQEDILLSSCSDEDVIRLWQLPEFRDRGHLNAIRNCRAITCGQGHIFAGDYTTGNVKVWKWNS